MIGAMHHIGLWNNEVHLELSTCSDCFIFFSTHYTPHREPPLKSADVFHAFIPVSMTSTGTWLARHIYLAESITTERDKAWNFTYLPSFIEILCDKASMLHVPFKLVFAFIMGQSWRHLSTLNSLIVVHYLSLISNSWGIFATEVVHIN